MRKLASIQTVLKINEIPFADKIELARVLGWQCVVNKGQFKEGDKAVYFEIDSFLPIQDVFEFLRKSSYATSDLLGEGFRLKTRRFKGQISQGLLLPVSEFPTLSPDLPIGTDVTELLGVRKWEVQERDTAEGTIVGTLPAFIPQTDEMRIQSEPDLWDEFKGVPYYITTKMDGQSHSIGVDADGNFYVTSRNCVYSNGKFYDLIEQWGYKQALLDYTEKGHTLVVQGELCGPGIQRNRLGLDSPKWYVFTIIQDGQRVGLNDLLTICAKLNMEHVPVEEVGENLADLYPNGLIDLLARATGKYESSGDNKEGIVIRPITPVYSKTLNDYLSMKVLNNANLIKE